MKLYKLSTLNNTQNMVSAIDTLAVILTPSFIPTSNFY